MKNVFLGLIAALLVSSVGFANEAKLDAPASKGMKVASHKKKHHKKETKEEKTTETTTPAPAQPSETPAPSNPDHK